MTTLTTSPSLKDIEIPLNATSTVSPSPVKSSSPTKSSKLSTPATTPSKDSTPGALVAKSPEASLAQDKKDGTASNLVDLDRLKEPPKSSWDEADDETYKQQEAEKEAQFQQLLAIFDPVATLVEAFSDTLKENPAGFVYAEESLASYHRAKYNGATVDKGSPSIPIDGLATAFFIPINVSRIHWILCRQKR